MKRLKGIDKDTHEYAMEHGRVPFVFGLNTPDGSAIDMSGSILPEDIDKAQELQLQMWKLHQKK